MRSFDLARQQQQLAAGRCGQQTQLRCQEGETCLAPPLTACKDSRGGMDRGDSCSGPGLEETSDSITSSLRKKNRGLLPT